MGEKILPLVVGLFAFSSPSPHKRWTKHCTCSIEQRQPRCWLDIPREKPPDVLEIRTMSKSEYLENKRRFHDRLSACDGDEARVSLLKDLANAEFGQFLAKAPTIARLIDALSDDALAALDDTLVTLIDGTSALDVPFAMHARGNDAGIQHYLEGWQPSVFNHHLIAAELATIPNLAAIALRSDAVPAVVSIAVSSREQIGEHTQHNAPTLDALEGIAYHLGATVLPWMIDEVGFDPDYFFFDESLDALDLGRLTRDQEVQDADAELTTHVEVLAELEGAITKLDLVEELEHVRSWGRWALDADAASFEDARAHHTARLYGASFILFAHAISALVGSDELGERAFGASLLLDAAAPALRERIAGELADASNADAKAASILDATITLLGDEGDYEDALNGQLTHMLAAHASDALCAAIATARAERSSTRLTLSHPAFIAGLRAVIEARPELAATDSFMFDVVDLVDVDGGAELLAENLDGLMELDLPYMSVFGELCDIANATVISALADKVQPGEPNRAQFILDAASQLDDFEVPAHIHEIAAGPANPGPPLELKCQACGAVHEYTYEHLALLADPDDPSREFTMLPLMIESCKRCEAVDNFKPTQLTDGLLLQVVMSELGDSGLPEWIVPMRSNLPTGEKITSFAAALSTYEALHAERPDDTDVLGWWAMLLAHLGQNDLAREKFERIAAAEPWNINVYSSLIAMAIEAGDLARVSSTAKEGISVFIQARNMMSDEPIDEHNFEALCDILALWSKTCPEDLLLVEVNRDRLFSSIAPDGLPDRSILRAGTIDLPAAFASLILQGVIWTVEFPKTTTPSLERGAYQWNVLARALQDLSIRQDSEEVSTTVRNEAKVGRNDPCICGSGKKYKKCCMRK